MSDVEPEVRDFLQRIMWSIFAGLVWLFTNMTAGIFSGWLFFRQSPTIGNIIFYIWLLLSLLALLWFYYRTWKKISTRIICLAAVVGDDLPLPVDLTKQQGIRPVGIAGASFQKPFTQHKIIILR